jgi:hypothetical protein
MLQIKVNNKWLDADRIGVWFGDEARGIYKASEIQDVLLDGEKFSFRHVMEHSNFANITPSCAEEELHKQYVQIPTLEQRLQVIEQLLYVITVDNKGEGKPEFKSVVLASFSQTIERNFKASEQIWNSLRNATYKSIDAISAAMKKQNELIEQLQKQIYELQNK